MQYFLKHKVMLNSSQGKIQTHLFAFVNWYRVHPQEHWFRSRIRVVSTDMEMNGPAIFLPIRNLGPVLSYQKPLNLIMGR